MAGTIVADTLQDGSGNSTATTNAIKGSAKAWVDYNMTTQVIAQSYNVSSVTYNGTGSITVNFTTALPNNGYIISGSGVGLSGTSFYGIVCLDYITPVKTTSACKLFCFGQISGSPFGFNAPDLGVAFIVN